MKLDENNLREEFKKLSSIRESIVSKSAPLRATRDKFVNDARDKEQKMNDEIKSVEKDLYEIDQQIGMIVRALKGKTSVVVEEEKSE
jgi:hypothetical protein